MEKALFFLVAIGSIAIAGCSNHRMPYSEAKSSSPLTPMYAYVYNEQGRPIEGAHLTVLDLAKHPIGSILEVSFDSGMNGLVRTVRLPVGTYTVQAIAEGYLPSTKRVKLELNKVPAKFVLKKEPGSEHKVK